MGPERAPSQAPEGVVVAGMHRSGTSAVTRALHALGLSVARGDDLMGPSEGNAKGHFESWSLTALNEELLLALGGTWSAPPELPPGWELGPAAGALLERAAPTFAATHPHAPWVWKDPRTSLLLPFWQRVLGPNPVVIVVRHPAEVARSLEARNGLDPEVGAALSFRYLRTLLAATGGLPALVTGWDRLRDDPDGWLEEATSWLRELRFEGPERPEAVARGVESGLSAIRLSETERRQASFVRPEEHELHEAAVSLEGAHQALPSIDLPEEPDERRRLLADRRGEELRALLAGGTAGSAEELRRYIERLEGEIRRQVEGHAETTAYARHLAEELLKRREAQEEVRAYVRHLEEQIRAKDAHIEELTRRVADHSSKNRR